MWKHIVWVVSNWHLIQVMLTAWSNSINTRCESICPCVPLSVCLPHPSGQYLFQISWNSQKIFHFNPLHTGCIHWFSQSSVMNWFLIRITKLQASGGPQRATIGNLWFLNCFLIFCSLIRFWSLAAKGWHNYYIPRSTWYVIWVMWTIIWVDKSHKLHDYIL